MPRMAMMSCRSLYCSSEICCTGVTMSHMATSYAACLRWSPGSMRSTARSRRAPSRMAAKERMVSSSFTYLPGLPGIHGRGRCPARRAVDDELLVFDSSSMPRMAMIRVLVVLQNLLDAQRDRSPTIAGSSAGRDSVGVVGGHRLGVKMRERRGRRRVGQVVGGNTACTDVMRWSRCAPADRPSRWPASAGSPRRRACGPAVRTPRNRPG